MPAQPPQLVTRSEFARRAGVSPAAVTKACQTARLRGATVGNMIDSEHPVARSYLAVVERPRRRGRGARNAPEKPGAEAKRDTAPPQTIGATALTDAEIDIIARRVAERLGLPVPPKP